MVRAKFVGFGRGNGKVTRRDFLVGAAVGGAGLAIAACTPSTSTPTASATAAASAAAVKGGHITFGYGSDIRTLNPLLAVDIGNQGVTRLLFEPLIDFNDKAEPVPALAAELPKVSADGTTYTFTLRDNVKWSDGRQITADDVVWTYAMIYDPANKEFNYSARAIAEANIASVTASDPRTVVLKTKQPYAPALANFGTIGILPKHVLGNISAKDLNTADFNSAPTVTSGMFKFSQWNKSSDVRLVRNAEYYRGAPNIETFIYKPVSGLGPSALKTGEVDWAQISPAQVAEVQAVSELRTEVAPTATTFFLAGNQNPTKKGSQFFGDKRVRQAMLYAIDRKAIADAVYFGTATVPESMVPAFSWAFTKPKTTYSRDKAQAERLLDEAGWRKNAAGMREKAGTPFKFEIVIIDSRVQDASIVQAIQAQLKEIGIEAAPRVLALQAYLQVLLTTRDFDAIIGGVGLGNRADPDLAFLLSTADMAAGGQNWAQYSNSEVDRLLKDGAAVVDRAKRKEHYDKLQDILADDVPYMPLLAAGTPFGVNKRLNNLSLGALTAFRNWWWMKDAYVSDGK